MGWSNRPRPADLDRLGWNTDAHVELLWSLSRAPDADNALRAMVRLADAVGRDWDELNQALVKDRGLRGRLFGVLGSSLALGDHLVAHPDSWHLLAGDVTLPSADELRAAFADVAENAEIGRDTAAAVSPLRKLYRDRLLVLAALDLASTVENEPVLPFATVGEHLSDLADAALGAALTVATRSVCGDDVECPRIAVIAMGKCGARELNYVSDVDVIFVAQDARRDRDQGGRRHDEVRGRHLLRGGRGAATGGQTRPAGAHAGLPHRVLPALGQDVGIPGAAEGPARGGRCRARPRSTSTR